MRKLGKNSENKEKTTTEIMNFSDAWNGFKVDYLPFVKWEKTEDGQFCLIKFLEDNPAKYQNKWDREQYKIKVLCDNTESFLSGGTRLFRKILSFCKKENKQPTQLEEVQIDRFGSGFDTDYSISYIP